MLSLPLPWGTSPDPETCRQKEPRQVSAPQPDSPQSVWGPGTAGCRYLLLPPQALELCAVVPHPGRGKSICTGCGGDSRVPLKGGGSIRSRWVCGRKKETFFLLSTTDDSAYHALVLFYFFHMHTPRPSSPSAHLPPPNSYIRRHAPYAALFPAHTHTFIPVPFWFPLYSWESLSSDPGEVRGKSPSKIGGAAPGGPRAGGRNWSFLFF